MADPYYRYVSALVERANIPQTNLPIYPSSEAHPLASHHLSTSSISCGVSSEYLPKDIADEAQVLCFVEFVDSHCALSAMKALQGYNFDDKNPDSGVLKIQFAHFPFRLPDHDNQRITTPC